MLPPRTLSLAPKSVLLLLCLLASAPFVLLEAQQLDLVVQIGHTGEVTDVVFSPDGKTLVSHKRS